MRRRNTTPKPLPGDRRYQPPCVSPGGMLTVKRVERHKVYYSYDDRPSYVSADDTIPWIRDWCWNDLPHAPPVPMPACMNDWVGRHVILLRAVTTGAAHFKAGDPMIVGSHYRGKLNLDRVVGPGSIRGVARHNVHLLPEVAALGRTARNIENWRQCRVLGDIIQVDGHKWVPVLFEGDGEPTMFPFEDLEPLPK